MFDISWSELLILGIVTLIFVGPKELPVFLRTIGKYVGMVTRQASEFREQFDTAMREAELDQIRKDMMGVKADVEKTVSDASRSVANEFDGMKSEFDKAATSTSSTPAADPDAHDADGIPLARPNFETPKPAAETAAEQPAVAAAPAVSPGKAAADAAAAAARGAAPATAASAPQPAEPVKSGV